MPWWPPSRGGLDRRDEDVGAHPAGDERLGAVDHVAAVDLARVRADRRHIGAGVGLGDRQRRDLLAADPGHQEALLLILGAEPPDRRQWRCRSGRRSPRPARPSRTSASSSANTASATGSPLPPYSPGTSGRCSRARRAAEHLVGEPPSVLPLRRACGRSSVCTKRRTDRAELLVLGVKGGIGRRACAPSPAAHARPAARCMHRAGHHSPYERPITSSMISSVPAPIRFRRRSRQTRSIPYSFM